MYSLCIEFETASTKQEVTDWFSNIEPSLPQGATATIKQSDTIKAAEELTKDDIGSEVHFTLPDTSEVGGTLDAVFPAGRHAVSRVLVVNGTAHLLNYGLVRVGDK